MRFGIEFSGAGATADPRILGELAHIAEASGWDGVFLEDYIVHHSASAAPTCDPWVALAVMAMRTDRVRLGTEVTALPRRRPWKLAREVASLDHLSQGRMVLGVGLGDVNDPGFTAVGEPTALRTRAELLDESLAIIDGIWREESFSFSGRHYHIEDLSFHPKPLQRPRVPIWIGGGWPKAGLRRRAPRWDGICAYIDTGSFEVWKDQTPDYVMEVRQLIASEGRMLNDYEIVTGGRTRGDDWAHDAEIISSLEAAGATWWVEYVEPSLDVDAAKAAAERGPLLRTQ